MWWLLIPGAAVAAYKVYDSLRDKGEESARARRGEALPDGQAVGDLPAVGPRLRRWIEIVRPPGDEEAGRELGAPSEGSSETGAGPAHRPWFRPVHLTVLTALAVVGATVLRHSVSDPWLDWTQQILLGALIGIGTNWVAIKMLFRPQKKHLAFIQGVIPANKQKIAQQIARGVSDHLLDRETIRQAVHDSDLVGSGLDDMVGRLQHLVKHEDFQHDVEELCVAYVGKFVADESFRRRILDAIAATARRAPERLGGVLGVFSNEIGAWLESMVHEHQDAILSGLEEQVPALVSEATDRLVAFLQGLPDRIEDRRPEIERVITESLARRVASFDVEGLVRRRLENFSVDDLEKLILSATEDQLAWLQYLGWIIGALAAPAVAGLEALIAAL